MRPRNTQASSDPYEIRLSFYDWEKDPEEEFEVILDFFQADDLIHELQKILRQHRYSKMGRIDR